jgi:hypothetical protein
MSIARSTIGLLSLLFLLLPLPTWATTYYVRTGGSDSNSCTDAQSNADADAKASIANAANNCPGPGDTIIVQGGHYYPGDFTIFSNRNGAPGNPITIRNAPNESVWVHGNMGLSTARSGGGFQTIHDWTIDGINFDGDYERGYLIYTDGDATESVHPLRLVLKNLECTRSRDQG